MKPTTLLTRLADALTVVFLSIGLCSLSCHSEIRFDDLVCAQDADCPLSSLHCLAGACVACYEDQHCTRVGFPRCDVALHRCVPCGVASDCAANQTCRSERCVTLCTGGCPASAPRCDDSVCGQCDTDDGVLCTSANATHCYQHSCVACLADDDCGGATPRCDMVTKSCVQCQANADCSSSTPFCDLGAGLCVSRSSSASLVIPVRLALLRRRTSCGRPRDLAPQSGTRLSEVTPAQWHDRLPSRG